MDNAGSETNEFEQMATALFNVMRRLREKHEDMTALQVMCLMRVAAKPGIGQRELQIELETGSNSTASRILGMLSQHGTRGAEGLNLVDMKTNPLDRRERRLYLSPKGKRLMVEIMKEMPSVSKKTTVSA